MAVTVLLGRVSASSGSFGIAVGGKGFYFFFKKKEKRTGKFTFDFTDTQVDGWDINERKYSGGSQSIGERWVHK